MGFNISSEYRLVITFKTNSTAVYKRDVDQITGPNSYVISVPSIPTLDFENLDLPALNQKVKLWLTFS